MLVHLLSLFLLAFAVSLDGFGVGVTYGLRHIRIPILSILIIAFCSGLVIWLSMWAGAWLTGYMTPSFARLLGAFILIGIGSFAVLQFWRNRKDDRDSGFETETDRQAVPSAVHGSAESPVSTIWRIELKRLGLVIHILRRPQAADMDSSGTISASEAVLLGSALSLDAFGAGLGAAMVGFSPLLTAVLIAFSSGVFLLLGLRVGLRLSAWRGIRTLSLLPGLILIMMGITRLL